MDRDKKGKIQHYLRFEVKSKAENLATVGNAVLSE